MKLYLLTPPHLSDHFYDQLEEALNADQGDIAALQLRLKPADDDAIKVAAAKIIPFLEKKQIPLIINDRPDLALAVGANGVHLGANDMPVREARKLLGEDYIIGASAYNSRHQAMQAGEAGADYVAFGAFFETITKKTTTRAHPDLLRQWHETSILPAGAIGGITPENAAPLIRAGADFLAVSSAIWHHAEGAGKAIALFHKTLKL